MENGKNSLNISPNKEIDLPKVLILSKPQCNFCVMAKALLRRKEYEFEEVVYNTNEMFEEFKIRGFRSFPQIYIDEIHIGGYTDLVQYFANNEKNEH